MKIKRVSILSKDYKKIKDIFTSSLPSNERLSSFLIYVLSLRKDIHYSVFYEEETIIGVMYTIETKKLNYLLYLVVNPELRSKGYGSKMLEWLKNKSKDKTVALDIEIIDDAAPNYAQRLKRLSFYEKNGFHPTDYTIFYDDQYYTVLTNTSNFKKEDLINLFKTFTFNLYKPDIKNAAI